ncbi:Leucine-, isoleucine-, valine-, threonine-, and alanine-binding protein [Sporomusa silvacetica DSM 10669]|uniref:Leucine-, isoleucine-, valine-, threonine-, and alanine-binding protein n=1 Tax=Sporomusa silvacetica DSM 10669 TaxID=1123289 RepID=A0ABZ3IU58_9FIRM|nr:ABC transporter substrate-binding protein [Sporomusa silvacetica]OZC19525.1 leucine-, isoleucine-, valine-, threonine-, and alanine-binding protein precursor [Sporomusa silvacetica DSM 10669]
MKNRGLISLCLIFLFLLTVIMAGCGSSSNTVKIGAIGPLTGESSIGGLDELDGKRMAVEDFNAKGGINGKKVELFSEDDASQPSQSAAAAMKLINQNKVVALVGAQNSACTLAMMEILSKYKIPGVTPGSSSPSITNSGNQWITRAFPGDEIQAGALVNYAKNKMNVKKIGVIYVNDDFGKGGFKAISKAAEQQGIEVVSESFMGEDKDMRTQLTKIKSANVDGLFIWCQYVPGSLIMKQAREMNWNTQFYGSTGILHPKTFELSGGAYAGAINSVPFIPNLPDPEKQNWVKRYKDKFGKEPSQNSARAYDATMLLLEAIKRANSTDPKVIQEAIRTTQDHEGLQGKISIDKSNGEYIGDVMIVKAETAGWSFVESVSSK